MKFADKIALVTGGRSVIGLDSAMLFPAEVAQVIITGRRQAELDAAVAAIPGAAGFRVDSAKLDAQHAIHRYQGPVRAPRGAAG